MIRYRESIIKGFFVPMLFLLLTACMGTTSVQKERDEGSETLLASEVVESASPPCPFPEDYPVRLVSVEVDPVYSQMLRPREEGWLGSDAAHSIPLSKDKILWLFGDTLIGKIADGRRLEEYDFINSTIGIQDRRVSPPDNINFYWKKENGMNASFFSHQPGTSGDFYWATMGALLDGELFIYCYSMDIDADPEWIRETTLIRISNPQDPPDQWIQKAYNLGIGCTKQNFHTAMYEKDPYVYFLGYNYSNDWNDMAMILARVLKSALLGGALGEAYEFWVQGESGPEWGSKPENLVPLFYPGVTESDIQYEPEWGLYICTTYSAEHPGIYITTAKDLTGPWSEPACIYMIPEHQVSFPIISYAVRPHPELSTQPGELILTYETNSHLDMESLFTKEGLAIYYPRFLRVQLELAK